MTWNHRVVRREYPGGHPAVMYEIHEAYYGLEGHGDVAVTSDPAEVIGESIDELRWTLEAMLRALDTPVLDYETREEIGDDRGNAGEHEPG